MLAIAEICSVFYGAAVFVGSHEKSESLGASFASFDSRLDHTEIQATQSDVSKASDVLLLLRDCLATKCVNDV